MAEGKFPARLWTRAPEELIEALDVAADRAMTTRAEYIRQKLTAGLRADGIDPLQFREAS